MTRTMNRAMSVWLCCVLLAACSDPDQGGSGKADTGVADSGGPVFDTGGPVDSGGLPDGSWGDGGALDAGGADSAGADGLADGGVVDSGAADGGASDGGVDVTAAGDGAIDGGGEPVLKCGEHLFSYEAPTGTAEVLLSGNFNQWADNASAATVLKDDDGDGTWTAVVALEPGTWEYKFIVDGKWIADPANPSKVDDTFGGFNSVLVMAPCPTGWQVISSAGGGESADFEASLKWLPGGLKAEQLKVTLDWQAVAAADVVVSGDGVVVKLKGLAKGIHDLRLQVGDEMVLLKILVGVSADWRDSVLYFVMTDRFHNGDKTNDAPVAGVDPRTNYQGGDFAGVTAKLKAGYFSDLHVGAIWLSWPVDNPDGFEAGGYPDQTGCNLQPKTTKYSEMKYTGNHGYWPSQLYKTDEHFGSMSELQALVNAAHDKGIRVLLDFTANHVHTASPFYAENKDKGWFHLPAEVCQDVGWDNKPVTCWFTPYLADLNYSNPAAIKAMLDYALFWAKQSGSDGFRLDAVKHVEMDFVKALRQRTKQEMELTGVPFYIVGETFTGDAGAIAAFVGDDRIHGQFDFPANLQILKGLAKSEIGLGEMDKNVRAAKAVYGPDALMSNFIGNHDIARFISHASGGLGCGIWDVVSNQAAGWKSPPKPPAETAGYERLKLAFTYIMTVPGVPLVYYGDEFGMPGAGDPDNRRMMRFDGDLNANETATLAFMQTLGQVRAAHPALRKGDWSQPLWADADVLAWGRTTATDKVVVMLNRSEAEKSGEVTVGGLGFADGAELVDALGGKSAKVAGGKLAWTLAARQAAIWVVK